jgi:hypothetical protein
MLIRKATDKYKATKFYRVGKGVGFAHSTVCIPRQYNLGRGKGQYFYHVCRRSKGKEIAQRAENSRKDSRTSEEAIPEGKAANGVPILSSLRQGLQDGHPEPCL